MTHRRTRAAALGIAALLALGAACSDGETTGDARATPATASPSASSPPTPSASPTASTPPTPSATATATATGNAPLACPETIEVLKATEGLLNEQRVVTPTFCSYGNTNTRATASIQSEDAFGATSLRSYRNVMRAHRKKSGGIRAIVQKRPDFGPGAFLLTLTGSRSGAITSLIVPRPGGQFASISVSQVTKTKFATDLEFTEELAWAFLAG